MLADVRSQPYSRYAPQFNHDSIKRAIIADGLKYLYLGEELGGRPKGDEFYDDEGYVLYSRVARSEPFLRGIARLEAGIPRYRVAVMCSEEDPSGCHRHLLIGRVLRERGVELRHIRGDGRVQTDLELELEGGGERAEQLSLFPSSEELPWRSLRSVSPRRPPPSFSGP